MWWLWCDVRVADGVNKSSDWHKVNKLLLKVAPVYDKQQKTDSTNDDGDGCTNDDSSSQSYIHWQNQAILNRMCPNESSMIFETKQHARTAKHADLFDRVMSALW